MRRLPAAIVTAALTGGLVGLAPQASAAPVCDPTQPISSFNEVDVAVGTKKVRTVELGVDTVSGCDVASAVAVLVGPRRTFRTTLRPQVSSEGTTVSWTGAVRLDPKKLRNAEAGTWTLRYEVSGDDAGQTLTQPAFVRRATRATFDAGPEPVKDGRITFRGTLGRASWDAHRYRAVRKPVVVQTLDREDDSFEVDVVALRTKKDGSFRTTVAFPGAGPYWVRFEGGTVSAPTRSRADRVVAG